MKLFVWTARSSAKKNPGMVFAAPAPLSQPRCEPFSLIPLWKGGPVTAALKKNGYHIH